MIGAKAVRSNTFQWVVIFLKEPLCVVWLMWIRPSTKYVVTSSRHFVGPWYSENDRQSRIGADLHEGLQAFGERHCLLSKSLYFGLMHLRLSFDKYCCVCEQEKQENKNTLWKKKLIQLENNILIITLTILIKNILRIGRGSRKGSLVWSRLLGGGHYGLMTRRKKHTFLELSYILRVLLIILCFVLKNFLQSKSNLKIFKKYRKISSRSNSSNSLSMWWMVSLIPGRTTLSRAFTRRLVTLIASSRAVKEVYSITGESVPYLQRWQLDNGTDQFLPNLSALFNLLTTFTQANLL